MPAAVEVHELVVRRGGVQAVDGISFVAEAGTVTALLGPNGAGKTTTVETLEGYLRPHAGWVRVLGLDPVADHRALVPRIGVMLQEGGVYPTMSAWDAVHLFAAYHDDALDPRALVDRVGLLPVATTPWRRLSGGEQRRLSLALALVGRPQVAFLDEPTAGVDPRGRQIVRDVVADLRQQGTCVLVTTHELDEAERMADRVLIIDRGRVIAAGSPAELRDATGTAEIRFGTAGPVDAAALAAHLGIPVHEDAPCEYVVAADASPAVVAELTAWLAQQGVPLADLRAGRHSLEDVFLRLTAEPSTAVHAEGGSERSPRARRGRR